MTGRRDEIQIRFTINLDELIMEWEYPDNPSTAELRTVGPFTDCKAATIRQGKGWCR